MEHDLLCAAAESPQDDVPRLVLADWLEEQGDPLSELIRVQCELAGISEHDPRRRELEHRERRLLADSFEDEVEGPILLLGVDWARRVRGFVEQAGLSATAFVESAGELFARAPLLQHVQLRRAADALDDLLDCEHLARIRSLDLTPSGLGAEEFALFLSRAPLDRLEALAIAPGRIGRSGMRILLDSEVFPRLKHLDLSHGGASWGMLIDVSSADGLELRSLDVRRTVLADDVVQRLADSPLLDGLQTLRFGVHHGQPGSGLSTLLDSPRLDQLQTLTVEGLTPRGRPSLLALAASTGLSNLRELDLAGSAIGDCGLETLLKAPFVFGVPVLALSGNGLTDHGARELARSPMAGVAHAVDVRNNAFGPAGRKLLRRRFGPRVWFDAPRTALV